MEMGGNVHEHVFWRIRRLQQIANHLRKHTCPQRTLLLGYPDTHQVPRSPTQQQGQRFVLRSPSTVNLSRTMSVPSVDRDATLLQLSWGVFTLTSTAQCLQIGPIYSPSLTHIPHPPAPVPPQLVVSSKAGGERAQFLVQVARRVTHSDRGRASPSAPLLLLTVSLILSTSLCAILNLGNTKHKKVNGNHFFALSFCKSCQIDRSRNTLRFAVRYSPANRRYIRWCCNLYTIARETCCDRM